MASQSRAIVSDLPLIVYRASACEMKHAFQSLEICIKSKANLLMIHQPRLIGTGIYRSAQVTQILSNDQS